jgi:hypothetical protein
VQDVSNTATSAYAATEVYLEELESTSAGSKKK